MTNSESISFSSMDDSGLLNAKKAANSHAAKPGNKYALSLPSAFSLLALSYDVVICTLSLSVLLFPSLMRSLISFHQISYLPWLTFYSLHLSSCYFNLNFQLIHFFPPFISFRLLFSLLSSLFSLPLSSLFPSLLSSLHLLPPLLPSLFSPSPPLSSLFFLLSTLFSFRTNAGAMSAHAASLSTSTERAIEVLAGLVGRTHVKEEIVHGSYRCLLTSSFSSQ